MKTKSKALLLTLCAVLLVAASILGTMAYLTSQDTVTNTFTVGNVKITLDEAKVGTDGKALTGNSAARVTANKYKLMPGHTYDKDPTVTVKAGSEACYVKMTVTVNNASTLDKLFKAKGIALENVVVGYDKTNWILKANTEDKANGTRTYEFWYKEVVAASATDTALDDLFEQIVVPGSINNTELESIQNTTIIVNAYAIQADGFATADAAWAAFPAE